MGSKKWKFSQNFQYWCPLNQWDSSWKGTFPCSVCPPCQKCLEVRWKIRDESSERAILIIVESRRTTNSKREFLSRGCRAIKSRDLKFGKKKLSNGSLTGSDRWYWGSLQQLQHSLFSYNWNSNQNSVWNVQLFTADSQAMANEEWWEVHGKKSRNKPEELGETWLCFNWRFQGFSHTT